MENEKIVYTVGTYVNIPEERIFGFICKKICVYGKLFRNNMNGFYN